MFLWALGLSLLSFISDYEGWGMRMDRPKNGRWSGLSASWTAHSHLKATVVLTRANLWRHRQQFETQSIYKRTGTQLSPIPLCLQLYVTSCSYSVAECTMTGECTSTTLNAEIVRSIIIIINETWIEFLLLFMIKLWPLYTLHVQTVWLV